MHYHLARHDSTIKLIIDQICYLLLSKISERSLRNRNSLGPMCASTSDLITHRIIATGSFERVQFDALDALITGSSNIAGLNIRKDGIFLDVGANIGLFSIRYQPYFSKVLAIEANPITFHVLQANILLRGCKGLHAICIGASNRTAPSSLKVDKDGMLGWSSIDDSEVLKNRDTFQVDIDLMEIDNILSIHCSDLPVSIIKLDIEGHEIAALEGAARTLDKFHPVVLYEKNSPAGIDVCASFLMGFGYDKFVVFERDLNLANPFSKTAVFAKAINPKSLGETALICAYREQEVEG